MKKILVALFSLVLARSAYAVPTGCFYTDYGTSCYSGSFYYTDCDQYNMTSYNFGNYVYSMCSYVNDVESWYGTCANTLNACQADLVTALSQRNNYASVADSTEKNRQEWIAYSTSQAKLIKKLYKACGTKCKRIK